MKAEKLSTEIAALERQSGKAKNAVIKKVLTGKINKLKAELEAITSVPVAKEKIKKAKSKISKMTVKEFASYIKQLAKDPKFSFLKSMTSDEIVRDIKRTAKPVGWRFRGRENVKKPTRKDIKENNNVYYEGRRNRSDVSRSVRLATGGGVNYNYEGQLPQKAVYSSVDEYLKNAKIGDLIWMGKDVNGFKLANKRDLMKIVELNGDDDFAFSFFGRKGKYTLASNNYDRNVVVVDNKKRENGGGVDINDLDMPVIRTQFEDEEYEYAKGGSVGDSGMITDKNSMFVGKMATITGELGNMYEVMVLDNGNKRTVLVKKNGISIVSDEYAKGGGVKYYNKENEYRLGRPSGSIEKEILNKVTFKNAISEQYFVGSFGWKTTQGKLGDGYLYNLDEFDQDLIKDLKLKSGEKIFRYVNRTTAIGGMTPFIKINLEKSLLYFPIHSDNDDIMFETKGVNPLFINIIEDKMANGGNTGEPHRAEMSAMMARGGAASNFKYEIYAENTNTGEKSVVALVKAYGDIPLMITGLKMGVTTSPIKYGFKQIK